MSQENARSLRGCLTIVLGHSDYTKFCYKLGGIDIGRMLGIEEGVRKAKEQVERIEIAAREGNIEEIRRILEEPITFGVD